MYECVFDKHRNVYSGRQEELKQQKSKKPKHLLEKTRDTNCFLARK